MTPQASAFDEKWGTDYEGKIGLGGKCFAPLNHCQQVNAEMRERLVAFQNSLPPNVYAFLYRIAL